MYKTATIVNILDTIKKENQKNATTRQKVTSKPARMHGRITYHSVTHLATRQENSILETDEIHNHNATKINNVGSTKIKLRQVQPLHAVVSLTTAPASTVDRNLSPSSTKFTKHPKKQWICCQ
jgi:hypothetical protein